MLFRSDAGRQEAGQVLEQPGRQAPRQQQEHGPTRQQHAGRDADEPQPAHGHVAVDSCAKSASTIDTAPPVLVGSSAVLRNIVAMEPERLPANVLELSPA